MTAFRLFCQVAYKKAVDDTARSFAEVRCVSFSLFVHGATSPVNGKEKIHDL